MPKSRSIDTAFKFNSVCPKALARREKKEGFEFCWVSNVKTECVGRILRDSTAHDLKSQGSRAFIPILGR